MTKAEPVSGFVDDFKNDERPRNISQFKTPDGVVCTSASVKAKQFSEKADSFIQQYETLYRQLARNNKKIYERSVELASLQTSSSKVLTKLATLLKDNLQNENASDLYLRLAKFNETMSESSLKIGATLNEYLNKQIKYQAKVEPDAFRQYQSLVD